MDELASDVDAEIEKLEPMEVGTGPIMKSHAPEYGVPASAQRRRRLMKKIVAGGIVIAACWSIIIGQRPVNVAGKRKALQAMSASEAPTLKVATWNVAAINNNPFEYWITIEDGSKYKKSYDNLMVAVENFLDNPDDNDVKVAAVFKEDMFEKLMKRVKDDTSWDNDHIQKVRNYWKTDYSNRKIVSGFMKDPTLGSKRLASMPDRVTNTVSVVPKKTGDPDTVFRPTVINMYEGDLSSLDGWFEQWSAFFFDTDFAIGDKGKVEKKRGYELLQPIKKSKYPAVTEDEEAISLPLQLVCQAVFDSIMVYMMNSVAQAREWQELKMEIVSALNKKKVEHTLGILVDMYSDVDVVALQEVSSSLVANAAASSLGNTHHVISPAEADAVRDQNSVLLLKKSTFPGGSKGEITSQVQNAFPVGVDVPVAKGDILAIKAVDKYGIPYTLASFHGDTNGLATIPVFDALVRVKNGHPSLDVSTLIFGLDANTYLKGTMKDGKKKTEDNMIFREEIKSRGYTHCWGDIPPEKAITTFNSRTYLQPQLNKACRSTEKRSNGDINPKDFIIFDGEDFMSTKTWKDNTGKKDYVEDMAFPTLKFPSDHGILGTVLKPRV